LTANVTSQIATGTQQYTPQARAERLIAAGRFVLASSSLVAVYLEPSTPARFQAGTYALLTIYVIYAIAMIAVAWRSPVPSTSWRLATHALDLFLFSLFIYFAEGPASPFFLYFIFSLFSATLRFSWRGILATGIAAIAIYGAMGLIVSLGDPEFEASRMLVREAYLAVISALLVYLGMYQQRLRTELSSLAAWPREPMAQLDELLHVTLAHAAATLKTSRIVLLWEEREEPWIYAATWAGTLDVQRSAPGVYGTMIAPELAKKSFYARAGTDEVLVYDPLQSPAVEVHGDAISPELRERFAFQSAIGVSLESESVSGLLLHLDVRAATADDLALAHIAGRLVLATIDQFFYLQQVRQTASAEERMRISRELHDGIVQSLGGAGLQLQAIRTSLPAGSPSEERIAHVQSMLEHDQGELRTIVRELRPHDPRDGRAILTDELRRMRDRFPLEWGLAVDVEIPPSLDLPAGVAHELSRIANESLSNAARHGGATHAAVKISRSGNGVDLSVTDNGRGFAFSGSYDLAALDRSGFGPRTLKERVTGLSGSLTVDSSSAGAAIYIRLPLAPEAAR
jgi:signal transduction histidine kinase